MAKSRRKRRSEFWHYRISNSRERRPPGHEAVHATHPRLLRNTRFDSLQRLKRASERQYQDGQGTS